MEKPTQSNKTDNPKDNKRSRMSPKAFKFDFVNKNDASKPQSAASSANNLNNFPVHKYLPDIVGFNDSEDINENYEKVIEEVLATYGDLRDLLLLNYLEEINEILPNLILEGPSDCIKFFHLVIFQCFEKIKESKEREASFSAMEEYEKLLQQAESKIRGLIRNENIFRVTFDQCIAKNEECQKVITTNDKTIEDLKKTIEALTKEKTDIAATLKIKEDEISQMKQKGVYIQNIIYNQPKNSPKGENSGTPNNNIRVKPQSAVPQNLKLMLQNNTPLSYGESSLTATNDSRKTPIKFKEVGSKTSRSVESKALFKPDPRPESDAPKGEQLKVTDLVKLSHPELKKEQRPLTDRKKGTVSRERGPMNSARLSDWYSFVNYTKLSNSQINPAQVVREPKILNKDELRSNPTEERSSFISKISKQQPDSNTNKTGTRTEPSDEIPKVQPRPASSKFERKTNEDPNLKLQNRRNKSQIENTSGMSTHRKKKSEAQSIGKSVVENNQSSLAGSELFKSGISGAASHSSIKTTLATSFVNNFTPSKKIGTQHKRSNTTTKVSSSLAKLIMDKMVPKNI